MRRDGPATDGPADGDGRPGDRPAGDSDRPAGDPPVREDEAHLAALLAVLAMTRTDAPPNGTPLQQWRARRLAALSADHSTVDAVDAARRLARPTRHRRAP